MSKKLIRLTEGDLHRIVKESVNNILIENINERFDTINQGSHKGRISISTEDLNTIKNAYIEIIKILTSVKDWDMNDPQGQALHEIWNGPITSMRRMFMHNIALGEYQDLHKDINW